MVRPNRAAARPFASSRPKRGSRYHPEYGTQDTEGGAGKAHAAVRPGAPSRVVH